MSYSWPLNVSHLTLKDKLRFAKYILTDDMWTQGRVVSEFEEAMADYVGTKYAIFTSSGSTANTLLAMYLQDTTPAGRDTIVLPSTTWITSVSPFAREGFNLDFVDVNLGDFSIDLNKLEDYLKKNNSRVACVFVTSLIGFTPNIYKLLILGQKYNVNIMMDNCENTLGKFHGNNVSSFFTSTTSTYFGHQIQSVEGGFIFTNNQAEYEYFMMARNHGMLRHLPEDKQEKYRNPDVDARFDFHMMGNNFRNTNLNAFVGLCDFKRAKQYLESRRKMYDIFCQRLAQYLILPRDSDGAQHAPFCLPFVLAPGYVRKLRPLKRLCKVCSIETRPVISGNLLRQSCLKGRNFWDYAGSEYLHQYGFYVGLHGTTEVNDVESLCDLAKITLESE